MWIDEGVEEVVRELARRVSRRSLLTGIGRALIGGAVIPLLPVARGLGHASVGDTSAFAAKAQVKDDTKCDYWRYCAIDGALCTCCGGTTSKCPPGSLASPSSWVGTCRNPSDDRTYIISYRDCCGSDNCGRCTCVNVDGESPVYRPQLNGDIIWCFGMSDMSYHCTQAAIVGEAT